MSGQLLTCVALVAACMRLLLSATPGGGRAQPHPLLHLEQAWLDAEANPDALESILADDFIHVLPVGFVTKQDQLDYLRRHPAGVSGNKHFESLRVRAFGDVGVVTGVVVASGEGAAGRRTAFTDVWAYRNGKWQAVNAQELPLGVWATTQESAAEWPANLREDVAAGNQQWIDGLKAGDARRAVLGFASDAVDCSGAGDCVKGVAAITGNYKEVIATFGRATRAAVVSEALRVDHDLAYESGRAEVHFQNGAVRAGRFSTVWKVQPDGHWRIFRNMSLGGPGAASATDPREPR